MPNKGFKTMFESLMKRFAPTPASDFAPEPVHVAEGVWVLDRQVCFPGGFRLPNRTTLIRTDDGSLLVLGAC